MFDISVAPLIIIIITIRKLLDGTCSIQNKLIHVYPDAKHARTQSLAKLENPAGIQCQATIGPPGKRHSNGVSLAG